LIRKYPTYWYGMAHRRFLESPPVFPKRVVSRETSAGPGVMVSRETFPSGPMTRT
jgi:hypothetical protein